MFTRKCLSQWLFEVSNGRPPGSVPVHQIGPRNFSWVRHKGQNDWGVFGPHTSLLHGIIKSRRRRVCRIRFWWFCVNFGLKQVFDLVLIRNWLIVGRSQQGISNWTSISFNSYKKTGWSMVSDICSISKRARRSRSNNTDLLLLLSRSDSLLWMSWTVLLRLKVAKNRYKQNIAHISVFVGHSKS